MPRPCKCRKIQGAPEAVSFKPCGQVNDKEPVILSMDEFEALRLADLNGLYQEDAAAQMAVSRQTFGNIITAAHRKLADAIINARPIIINSGHCPKSDSLNYYVDSSCSKRKNCLSNKKNKED